MKKERLSMYVDITRITIILCWIALIAFWCLKLFGGNWFEIMVENENFIKFSDLVQNTWVKYIVSFVTMLIGNYLMFGAISQKFYFSIKETLIIICLIISMWFVVNFVKIDLLTVFYGYIVLITYGIVKQQGWKKLYGLLSITLELIFTIISMVVRNIEPHLVSNYMLAIILSIDIYIMYALYYCYFNLLKLKKEL